MPRVLPPGHIEELFFVGVKVVSTLVFGESYGIFPQIWGEKILSLSVWLIFFKINLKPELLSNDWNISSWWMLLVWVCLTMRWFTKNSYEGMVDLCSVKVIFYGFYHGKSPWKTTIWDDMFYFFQPPKANPRSTVLYGCESPIYFEEKNTPMGMDVMEMGGKPITGYKNSAFSYDGR